MNEQEPGNPWGSNLQPSKTEVSLAATSREGLYERFPQLRRILLLLQGNTGIVVPITTDSQTILKEISEVIKDRLALTIPVDVQADEFAESLVSSRESTVEKVLRNLVATKSFPEYTGLIPINQETRPYKTVCFFHGFDKNMAELLQDPSSLMNFNPYGDGMNPDRSGFNLVPLCTKAELEGHKSPFGGYEAIHVVPQT